VLRVFEKTIGFALKSLRRNLPCRQPIEQLLEPRPVRHQGCAFLLLLNKAQQESLPVGDHHREPVINLLPQRTARENVADHTQRRRSQ
jgi:hypothetical protein